VGDLEEVTFVLSRTEHRVPNRMFESDIRERRHRRRDTLTRWFCDIEGHVPLDIDGSVSTAWREHQEVGLSYAATVGVREPSVQY